MLKRLIRRFIAMLKNESRAKRVRTGAANAPVGKVLGTVIWVKREASVSD
jgi:hypothetical protein